MTKKKGEAGLTIIEMLVATVLLGVLAAAILAPLTGLFQMTTRSTQTLSVTTQAQEVMESIQGQWRSYPTAHNPLDPTPARNTQRSGARAEPRALRADVLGDVSGGAQRFGRAGEGLGVGQRG